MIIKVNTMEFVQALKLAKEAINERGQAEKIIRIDVCFSRDGSRCMLVSGISPTTNITIKIDVEANANASFGMEPTKLVEGIAAFQQRDTILDVDVEKGKLTVCNGEWKVDTGIALSILSKRPRLLAPDSKMFKFSAEDLERGIRETSHAILSSDISIASCYHLEPMNGTVRVTATDGKSLSIRGPMGNSEGSVIVPNTLLTKVAPHLEGDVTLLYNDKSFELSTDRIVASGEQHSSSYYDVNKILKKAKMNQQVVYVDKNEMDQVLRAISPFSVDALFRLEGQRINVEANDEISKAHFSIPCKGNREIAHFRANLRRIRNAIRTVSDDNVKMGVSAPHSPIVIEGNDYTELIMPIAMRR